MTDYYYQNFKFCQNVSWEQLAFFLFNIIVSAANETNYTSRVALSTKV